MISSNVLSQAYDLAAQIMRQGGFESWLEIQTNKMNIDREETSYRLQNEGNAEQPKRLLWH